MTDDAKRQIAAIIEAAPIISPEVLDAELRQATERALASAPVASDPTLLLSEDAVARRFGDLFEGKLRFDHSLSAWFEWAGTHWQADRTNRALEHTRDLARALGAEFKEHIRKEVGRYRFAQAVERFAANDIRFAVTSDAWDADAWLLGTPGGTLDLKTGKLRPAAPGDNITKQTAVAPAVEPDCPTWKTFIAQVTQGDAGYARFLQQFCGYCLTGTTREHALLFAFGQGGRGKGTFIGTVVGILKDYAATAPIETFIDSRGERHPTELAMLRGARLVTASETEQGRSWAEAKLKMLTGGDKIAARFMRGDFFEFTPTFKLMIIGNHRPTLRNVGDAERRRFNLAPFDHKPAVPDPLLSEKLKSEWPAILTWMVDGCLDWQENGFVRPEIVTAATEEYFAGQDILGAWLEAEVDHQPGNDFRFETSSALYGAWKGYAGRVGEREGTMKAFVEKLQARGFQPHRKGTGRGFRGVILKAGAEPPDGEETY